MKSLLHKNRQLTRALLISSVAAVAVAAVNEAAAEGRPAEPDIVLDELSDEGTARRLGPVPAYAGGQVAQGGRLGLLGNTEAQKAPFSIVSYTDALVRDRQARTVSEALVVDPSVRATQTTGAPVSYTHLTLPPKA